MKNFIFLIAALCLLASSCALPVSYFGDKFPPTQNVDIYYSAHDVKKDYKVIGHMNYLNIGQEKVKDKFIEHAKSIGADAIIITGNTVDMNGKGGSDVVNADALKYD